TSGRRSTASRTPRWRTARRYGRPRTSAFCTHAASAIPTVTRGRSSGWTPPRSPGPPIADRWRRRASVPGCGCGARRGVVRGRGQTEPGEVLLHRPAEERDRVPYLPRRRIDVEDLELERAVDAIGLAHVETEGGLPVGDGRQHDLVAGLLGRAVALDEGADGVGTLVPAGERWHLPDRLVGEHRGDRVDVVAFERRHVAREQLALGVVVEDGWVGARRVGLRTRALELRTGPLEE